MKFILNSLIIFLALAGTIVRAEEFITSKHRGPIVLVADKASFSSWDDAIKYVRRNFRGEVADTSSSSWIRGAEYYYADGEGFLIINMNGKDYIFRGVPLITWQGFKSASSFGTYYNQHLKDRYYFDLNKR